MTRQEPEEHERETPEVCRAAIYLCGPELDDRNQLGDVPPIEKQRLHCRRVATVIDAEVVGEFVDESMSAPWRSGLHEALLLAAEGRPLEYLIVYSRERLASDCTEMFDVAWRLGLAGTAVIAADEHYEMPWTEM